MAWPGRAPVRHAIRQTGAVSRHKGLKLNALLARTLDEIVDALAAIGVGFKLYILDFV